MERLKPTRSEFHKTWKKIGLARKGRDLLKKKQDSLIMEFFLLLKGLKKDRERLQAAYDSARRRMNEARALESDLRIESAALIVQEHAPITVSVKNIAGVRIPEIRRESTHKETPLYNGVVLQDLGMAYHTVVDLLILVAARETAVRKLLGEIKKTKRRVHALEHVLIPKLETGLHHIQFELEEREREEFNRLKHRKE